MAKLVLNNISKMYGDQTVVKDLYLEIPAGAFTAFLGPSGCGKTTTLRMLAGLESVSAGELFLGDRLLANHTLHIPPEDRHMSMVFQSYALWPHMTVAENVGYPLKIQKMEQNALQKKVNNALEIVGLERYASRSPQELSGGQRQRVALARCLVSNPKVVLLDEPLANLDRHLRATMEETFREFHQQTGATFIYVTHDQAEAMSLASHIAVMDQGKLMQWGTPQELYQNPNNPWVASFIGQGSIVNLSLDQTKLTSPFLSFDLLQNTQLIRENFTDSSAILLRPQHVVLSDEGMPATIINAIYQGERYLLSLKLENGQTVQAFHENPVLIGSLVKLQFKQGWKLSNE